MIVSARCSFREPAVLGFQLLHTRVDRTWGRPAPNVPQGALLTLPSPVRQVRAIQAFSAQQRPQLAKPLARVRLLEDAEPIRRREPAALGFRRHFRSGAVAADLVVGPKAEGARRAPSAFGPTTTSISTAGGMQFIHQTLPAPTLISIRRLSHRSLAQGEGRGHLESGLALHDRPARKHSRAARVGLILVCIQAIERIPRFERLCFRPVQVSMDVELL